MVPLCVFRKIEKVIEEIKEFIGQWHPELLVFSDEVFTMKKSRLLAFCEEYGRAVGLPFHCQSRANTINEETAAALKKAGCTLISLGIESGNEFMRNSVLNRRMSDEQIRGAFRLLKKAGVPTGSFNMIGMPGETEEMLRETIRLNRKIQPTFARCTILMPLKGTAIRKVYEGRGLLEKEPSASYYTDITQSLPTISKQGLRAYKELFGLYVYIDSRFLIVADFLFFLWSKIPITVGKISFARLLRSITYRLTRLAYALLTPKSRGPV